MVKNAKEMETIITNLRQSFNSNVTKSLEWRLKQLNNVERLIDENKNELCEALKHDLNKANYETTVMEFGMIKNEITVMRNNLSDWIKPQKTHLLLKLRPLFSTYVHRQPLGVVLIIGAWNYPYQLTLVPLVGAIASGNCAIVKPSELAPKSAELLEKLWPKYFDSKTIALVNGGVDKTTELLSNRFDHIFYTGNTQVGKIIMQAAAKFMTPVTLECGGKSPTYIDDNVDINIVAKRLTWGKFVNAGQTCIAPDYVLCSPKTFASILPLIEKHLREFYGDNPKESASFGRIINERHFNRLLGLIEKTKVALGGESDASSKYISPTILQDVKSEDKCLQEEIFGPILPFVSVSNRKEAIDFINNRDKPLALYVFTKNSDVFEDFKNNTSSGSIVLNDVLMQAGLECLPFGGVGPSGIGRYHGRDSFETFTHPRAMLTTGFRGESLSSFRYPPYTDDKAAKTLNATSESSLCVIL